MSYIKPVVVASTMLVATLSVPAFADHMNYATTMQPQGVTVDYNQVIGRNSPVSNTVSPTVAWEKRIFVGGLVNGDLTYAERGWNSSVANFTVPDFNANAKNSDTITLNNANLFVEAKINDFTKGHVGLVVKQRPGQLTNDMGLDVDEAYATFSDFCQSPFYLQAGRKFTSFGNYDPYPITYSLTQLLTETDEEVVELGYVSTDGFHGAIYAFNGPNSEKNNRINNFGADLGFNAQYDNILYNVGIGYVKDIRDSQFLVAQLSNSNFPANVSGPDLSDAISQQAGGLSLHADVTSGPFEGRADYVQAMRQIIASDGNGDVYDNLGTKVSAYGLRAGFGFDSIGYVSQFALGYQHSNKGWFLGMPRERILADYNVTLNQNTKVTLEYAHNKDYNQNVVLTSDTSVHGQNSSSNVATVRVGVAL